ncbi:MAG: hypothetical protein KJO44_08790 [Gemmatimonadetes bacterium]|nr:hypothetical protein [Gemmatimonadota bacterium]MBT8478899.1 hypothetical protein [Gemmatimonadota bacterium]NNK48325.1 hypothetical protein [Gemmatimonadota bacterium]
MRASESGNLRSSRILPIAAVVLGGLAILVGLGLVGAYILEAIVARRGEPDQSLLFWYLPFFFAGLFSFIAGVAASVWGLTRLRRSS